MCFSCFQVDRFSVMGRTFLFKTPLLRSRIDSLGTFKDKDGKFKEQLANDIKGLISLFEASKLSIPSDIILEDAKEFSGKFLKASLEHIEHYEAKLIVNTLRYPYYQSLPRLTAKKFLPNCTTFLKFCHGANSMNGWVDEVQDLARIDMNMAHFTNQDEITHVSRWWKKLKLAEESKVARHKPVIWHMWSMALLPNPDMAEQRIELTKPISLIYIIDDLFDTCATTLEDLIVFTEAITKWECTYVEGLPDYMNLCLKTLHDITNETCYKIYQRYGWDPKDSLKTAWADLCKAFLVEARWFASGYLPTTEEYVKNGIVSSGVAIMSIYVFSILGENLYDTTADLFAINNYPEIVSSTAIIFRLWNGLGGAKDENQEAYDGSFIACYMNEYKGSSHESAEQHALGMISDTWKCLNKACLSNSPFSADFKAACLNMARMIPVMYNYDFTY